MALFVPSLIYRLVLIHSFLVELTLSQQGPYPETGRDLATFVSRPDLRPPTFNITVYDPDYVTPGYWFMAPYTSLLVEHSRIFRPSQIGPHIFDNQGNLIWSGATVSQRPVLDFKVGAWNDSLHLSLILIDDERNMEYPNGAGFIMDSSYTVRAKVLPYNNTKFGMHEFNIINEGRSALITTGNTRYYNGLSSNETLAIYEGIFQEIEIQTGEPIFAWNSLDHVQPSESFYVKQSPEESPLDYFHLNSVDKNAEGDYLVSARFTNCIYKVSSRDGSIIWRLGGKNSSFILEGFNFSGQHDARFITENSTTTIISFLNNASNQFSSTANYSSAMLVALNTATSPMTATVIKQWDRPDKQLTELRGNVQVLPNANIFVGWSANGYISEFTADGRCVLEAQFESMRFATYRAYKFNFTASPIEPPDLKAYVYGAATGGPEAAVTVCWVSWNGATEVSSWNFYGPSKSLSSRFTLIGSTRKSGFETMFTAAGYLTWVIAEAVAANGSILGRSEKQETILTQGVSFASSGSGEDYTNTLGIAGSLFDAENPNGDQGDGIQRSSSSVSSVDQAQKSIFDHWRNYLGLIFACISSIIGVCYVGFGVLRLCLGRFKIRQHKYVILDH